ncbi:MAG TPA: squalene--hopene cyclase [Methylocella sp.]|nr:squalene--hopene cyclase [Methylocella sp.]
MEILDIIEPDAGLVAVEAALSNATEALLAAQRSDGHFVFELEADTTIPSEYILFKHFLGEPADAELEAKLATFIRRQQAEHGGWPLFKDGAFNISCSVKAYFALKAAGEDPDSQHMQRARAAILAHGGAARTNVFTRALLSLFGAVPWRAVPVMPVEIMLLPRWFPFHMSKISYWSRTVITPLVVVNALKPRAKNPRHVTIGELFAEPPDEVRRWPGSPQEKFPWTQLFGALDQALRWAEPYFPKGLRKRAIERAVSFVEERLNGENGLGAIFPAMTYSGMMFYALGVDRRDPRMVQVLNAIDRLLIIREDEAYCQPCVSPVWDTALAAHALMEAGGEAVAKAVGSAVTWLKPLQITDIAGDWAVQRPHVHPGGWAFQYANPHYPDVDDTAVVAMAMDRAGSEGLLAPDQSCGEAITRAREWIEGLQSRNGGWGAFDADNDYDYLNYIPFADHGALLDPPTADVTARCLSLLTQLGPGRRHEQTIKDGIDYLLRTQEKDGSWYGRWGMNYIYGTWSVLCALNSAKRDPCSPEIKKAVDWLKAIQNDDGGWGEGGESYALDYAGYRPAPSTPSQTAWALLGLMAAGVVDDESVTKGMQYLARTQSEDGFWQEERFTATGFPRVFYLRYHGYAKYFPLWALARYRNLKNNNGHPVLVGM